MVRAASHSFWRAFGCGLLVALLLQLFAGISIVVLEFIGLAATQRAALRYAEFIYLPAIEVFFAVIPRGWAVTGNVLLGLLSLLFAAGVYALAFGLLAGIVSLLRTIRKRSDLQCAE